MDIDLSLLHSQTIKEKDISGTYSIPKEYYFDPSVISINDIKLVGKVYMAPSLDDIDELTDYIKADISGTIILQDYIML